MTNMRSGNSNHQNNETKKNYYAIIAVIVLVMLIIGFVVVLNSRAELQRTSTTPIEANTLSVQPNADTGTVSSANTTGASY